MHASKLRPAACFLCCPSGASTIIWHHHEHVWDNKKHLRVPNFKTVVTFFCLLSLDSVTESNFRSLLLPPGLSQWDLIKYSPLFSFKSFVKEKEPTLRVEYIFIHFVSVWFCISAVVLHLHQNAQDPLFVSFSKNLLSCLFQFSFILSLFSR